MRSLSLQVLWMCSSCLLLAVPAGAATRAHLNRCADATREIRGATSQVYKDRDVEPGEAQRAIGHINQHIDRLKRAQQMLDSAGPWDASDPALAECVGLMQQARSYIESTSAKIKAAQEAGVKQAPVLEAAKGDQKRQALYKLAAVHMNAKANSFDNMKPSEAKALVDSLAPVAAACQQAMPEAIQTPPAVPEQGAGGAQARVGGVTLPGNLVDKAGWWCWVAGNRDTLAAKALTNVYVIAESYGNYGREFAEILTLGSNWTGSTEPWVFEVARDDKPFFAGLHKAIGAWYAAFGLPVPAQPFPGLQEVVGKVRQAIVDAAARNPVTAGSHHDKKLEAEGKSALAKIYPKVSVLSSWMDEAAWTIEQNALGVPLKRFRSGQLVYKVGGTTWCVQRTFNWVEVHMGGGKYQPPGGAGILGGVKAVQCP